MKRQKHDTQWMVSVALMAAIVIVLAKIGRASCRERV